MNISFSAFVVQQDDGKSIDSGLGRFAGSDLRQRQLLKSVVNVMFETEWKYRNSCADRRGFDSFYFRRKPILNKPNDEILSGLFFSPFFSWWVCFFRLVQLIFFKACSLLFFPFSYSTRWLVYFGLFLLFSWILPFTQMYVYRLKICFIGSVLSAAWHIARQPENLYSFILWIWHFDIGRVPQTIQQYAFSMWRARMPALRQIVVALLCRSVNRR